MIYQALVTSAPNCTKLTPVSSCDQVEYATVRVKYASICRTDLEIISGRLGYYQENKAKYPIITGHEWCGVYEGQPVVGVCLLRCDNQCEKCKADNVSQCIDRKEVGVLNYDGAHAEYVVVPVYSLVAVEDCLPKFALVEPLAVVLHALARVNINSFNKVLVSGLGNIGRLAVIALQTLGKAVNVFDPYYFDSRPNFETYDLILECSGSASSVNFLIGKSVGSTILTFGFAYDLLMIEKIMVREINIVTTLGSSRSDFVMAAEMMGSLQPGIDAILGLENYVQAFRLASEHKKVVLQC